MDHLLPQLTALLAHWDQLAEDAKDKGDHKLDVDAQRGFMYGAMYGVETCRDELVRVFATVMLEQMKGL
jgi:hypothetical protein